MGFNASIIKSRWIFQLQPKSNATNTKKHNASSRKFTTSASPTAWMQFLPLVRKSRKRRPRVICAEISAQWAFVVVFPAEGQIHVDSSEVLICNLWVRSQNLFHYTTLAKEWVIITFYYENFIYRFKTRITTTICNNVTRVAQTASFYACG